MVVERAEEVQISPVLPLFTWSLGSVRPKVLILLLLGQPCMSEQGLKRLELGI